jgi:hypothetical protein
VNELNKLFHHVRQYCTILSNIASSLRNFPPFFPLHILFPPSLQAPIKTNQKSGKIIILLALKRLSVISVFQPVCAELSEYPRSRRRLPTPEKQLSQ